jgi:TPR repeat protein
MESHKIRRVVNILSLLFAISLLGACASQSTLEKYQTKADEGDIENQLLLADSYFYGTKDLAKDKEMAIKYYRLAAESGDASAAFNLGLIYQKENKYDESVYFYEMAVEKNHLGAQDNLGILYHHGRGVEQDFDKAEKLYLQALSNGSRFSQRNLAVLYRDSQQLDKAIDAFTTLAFAPTTKDNPRKFKSAISQNLMDLYIAKNDDNNAYIWGSTAVLSGLFDSNIEDAESKLARYESILNKINENDRASMSKAILSTHYKAFQQYEHAIDQRKEFLVSDGIIKLPTDKLVGLTGYKIQMKKDIYGGINAYKNKEDKKSRINLALYTLRLASYEISIGAIDPHFYLAKSNIKDSLSILDDYDDKNLISLKNTTNLKLDIVNGISNYQQETIKALK